MSEATRISSKRASKHLDPAQPRIKVGTNADAVLKITFAELLRSCSRTFCYAGEMTDSLDQFVLIKASKSRGGVWSDDDYYVRDRAHNVVGRIMLHPQAPKDWPWFWTITAREISPSVHNRGYSTTREQAMTDFKARWLASTN